MTNKTPKPIVRGRPHSGKINPNRETTGVDSFIGDIVNSYKRVGQGIGSVAGLTKNPYTQKNGGTSWGQMAMDFASVVPIGGGATLGGKAIAKVVGRSMAERAVVRSADKIIKNAIKTGGKTPKVERQVIRSANKIVNKSIPRSSKKFVKQIRGTSAKIDKQYKKPNSISSGAENLTKKTSTTKGLIKFNNSVSKNTKKANSVLDRQGKSVVREASKITKTSSRTVTPRVAKSVVKKAEKITKKGASSYKRRANNELKYQQQQTKLQSKAIKKSPQQRQKEIADMQERRRLYDQKQSQKFKKKSEKLVVKNVNKQTKNIKRTVKKATKKQKPMFPFD